MELILYITLTIVVSVKPLENVFPFDLRIIDKILFKLGQKTQISDMYQDLL